MDTAPVRVRYAPSPTGSPHIGNIRTALFNWLLARHSGGTFIVRIEDTDQGRLVPGATEAILASLRWLGLEWDEGPEVGGNSGPYLQSERLSFYHVMAETLIANGWAYRCFCTPERLEAVRAEQNARKEAPRYDRHCRDLPADEVEKLRTQGATYVVRFRVPLDGHTTVSDLFRGNIEFDNSLLDDHVLLKSDGWPTYQLANVVDDHLMGITHVLRGDEWISSAPKHVLEYQAFGWQPPLFGHFALILGKDRSKLSKRHGATDVLSYRSMGYLPDALVNFLALLGWSPPEDETRENADVVSRDELVRLFSLNRVGVTPSVFDTEKLDWMNGFYIRKLPAEELADALMPFLRDAGTVPQGMLAPETVSYIQAIMPLIRERIKRLTEAPDMMSFFFADELEYDATLLVVKGMDADSTRGALSAAQARLEALPVHDHESLEESLTALTQELGVKTGQLFGILRVAVTGRTVAPPLFQTMAVLGRERNLARVKHALRLLSGLPN